MPNGAYTWRSWKLCFPTQRSQAAACAMASDELSRPSTVSDMHMLSRHGGGWERRGRNGAGWDATQRLPARLPPDLKAEMIAAWLAATRVTAL